MLFFSLIRGLKTQRLSEKLRVETVKPLLHSFHKLKFKNNTAAFIVFLSVILGIAVLASINILKKDNLKKNEFQYFLQGKRQHGSDWIPIGKSKLLYYNATYKQTSKDYDVAIKNFLEKPRTLQFRAKYGYPTKGYEKYYYSIARCEMTCGDKEMAVIEIADYDTGNKVLSRFKIIPIEKDPIQENSVFDLVWADLCAAKQ